MYVNLLKIRNMALNPPKVYKFIERSTPPLEPFKDLPLNLRTAIPSKTLDGCTNRGMP